MNSFFSIGLTVLLLTACSGAQDRIASEEFTYLKSGWQSGDEGFGWNGKWVLSGQRPALLVDGNDNAREVLIQGTGERNNPLRRELKTSVRDPEMFVRFNFRYDPEKDSKTDDSEFFVMWFDRVDGGDRAVHGAGIPNIGIHVADQGPKKGKVVFIVRIGSDRTTWSTVDLKRGKNYQVVARLSKTDPDERAAFDRLELWVDPKSEDRDQPAATVVQKNGVNFVRWIGFATGRKTEPSDRILIDDLALSRTWNDVLDLSADKIPDPKKITDTLPPSLWTETVSFKKDVYPLLKSKCFSCHKGANSDSGYRLDVRSEVLGYSTGDPLAIPGDGPGSKLFALTVSDDPEKRMPPPEEGEHALTPLESDLLRTWIDQGMEWDEKLLPEPNASSDHWSFQPVKRPHVPTPKQQERVRTPVDAFVVAAQEEQKLRPSEEASRRTLIRRLSLNLIGLPPTPEEVEDFLNNSSGTAYADLVDRLLESPHYGERWGRYWLDLARWGESHGYQHDIPRPYAWRYRDYVIDAFNEDKPYDRFLLEQLAGDELTPRTDENLIATGFLAAARISGNQMDKSLQRNDVLVDIVNATGSAMLGLTLECAQCHNHKFDQLSQRDYYRMQAFFVNGQLGNVSLGDPETPNPTNLEDWMSVGSYKFYMSEAAKLVKRKTFAHTEQPHTWGFYSPKTTVAGVERLPVVNRDPLPWNPEILKTAKARLLIRGEVTQPGPVIESGWPEVLGKSGDSEKKSLTRTELANWMSDPENPLVSRVWVNRLWQYHFGKGIVATPGDFGIQGEAPSHPELLDWLASELIENNWSTKHIHRLIVMSSTYQQKRLYNEANAEIDPDNTYLWNWPQRRLEAEAIRDSVLVATGELKPEVGGPGVDPEREEANLRRTVYLTQRRSEMPRVMTMFDGPEVISSCSHREVSTVALQPLYLLNSGFMKNRADKLAAKVKAIAGDDLATRIETAFERTLGRSPDDEEKSHTLTMLKSSPEPEAAFIHFCHALLNLNEFVYLN